jgi:hypothetical protein
MAHLMDLENPLNPLITGGLRSFLTGPLTVPAPGQPARHDFFAMLNLDLGNRFKVVTNNDCVSAGYRVFGNLPAAGVQSFIQVCCALNSTALLSVL